MMRAWQLLLVAIVSLTAIVARAETIDVSDDHGGLLSAYQAQWATLAAQGVNVRIVGPCVSACTVLLGYIPNKNICVTPSASFGFHLATTAFATEDLLRAYPPNVRLWIDQHGGLTSELIWLQAPALYRFFRPCGRARPALTASPVERARIRKVRFAAHA